MRSPLTLDPRPLAWVPHPFRVRLDVVTVLGAAAALAIAAFLLPALLRLGYPYPLESTEQASIEQVQRVLNGQPLYVAPTLQHVPLIYGPVYYYLSAGLASLVGLSYVPLRLVSLVATLGMLWLVALLVERETRRRVCGLAAAGLLAATLPLSGVFDIGHVDATFVVFLLAAAALVRLRSDTRSAFAAGVLVAIAGLTKVPIGALPVAAALGVYLLVFARWRAAAFLAGLLIALAIGVTALAVQDGTWATWYLFDLPGRHQVNNHGDALPFFWLRDILPRFGVALLLGPIFLIVRCVDGRRRPIVFYALLCGSLLAVGWAARSNSGGGPNVLLPAHLAVALLFGLGIDGVLGLLSGASARVRALRVYIVAVCLIQFGLLGFNPRLLVPYRSEQWAADRLSAALTSLDGPLFAPNLDAYVRGSDKGEQPLFGAVMEITGSYGGPGTAEGRQWKTDFANALRERRFAHVVLIEDCCDVSSILAENGYVAAGPLLGPTDDYWLWTDGRTPDQFQVYVPRT